jgi:ketosteroid isomerase-like protein
MAYAAWDAAFNTGDAKALAALYEQDAIFLPATHDVIKGPDGVEKFFGGLFGMGVTGHKLELIDASGDDKLLFGTAKWSAKGKDAKGADQPWAGVATHVFEKQADGSLKLRVHTFN